MSAPVTENAPQSVTDAQAQMWLHAGILLTLIA